MTIALFAPHLVDDLAHLVFLVGIEPVRRLVEDQHLWVVQQRLGDADTPPEALRQGFDRLMHDLGDVDRLDDPAYAPLGLAAAKNRGYGR